MYVFKLLIFKFLIHMPFKYTIENNFPIQLTFSKKNIN